uniref:Calcium-binding protein n=1 Tax=Schistocephalus solidus TaxID=70667 RepID=A0A0X3PZ96_SCHSO
MTKESKTRQLLEAFKAADLDKDGFISEEELRNFFAASQIDNANVKPYMDLMDLTRDGRISLGEYKMGLGLSTFSVDNVKQIFERLDIDRSGTITESEIDRLTEEGVPSAMVEHIRDWLRKNDVNGDGQFDFKEFLGAVASLNI